jgi:hypothetical protein
LFSILIGINFSCDRITNKAKEVVRDNVLDPIRDQFPEYNCVDPDVDQNYINFENYFELKLEEEITQLYYCSDEMGIDQKYWFSFEAEDSTVMKVVSTMSLSDSIPNEMGISNFYAGREWWNDSLVDNIEPYWRIQDDLYQFLWYDKELKKAWFLDFDL